jgi:hypothetical protein
VVDRHTYPDHPSYLAFRRAPLNECAHPIHRLKREGRWVVKSLDLERFFPIQRQAINAAIRLRCRE